MQSLQQHLIINNKPIFWDLLLFLFLLPGCCTVGTFLGFWLIHIPGLPLETWNSSRAVALLINCYTNLLQSQLSHHHSFWLLVKSQLIYYLCNSIKNNNYVHYTNDAGMQHHNDRPILVSFHSDSIVGEQVQFWVIIFLKPELIQTVWCIK